MKYLLVCLVLVGFNASAQEFEKKIYISSKGDTLPYRILYPEGYDKSKKYPLVLFLHGGGERGRDNEKQLTNGVKLFLDPGNRKNYPCIVIVPQCMPDSQWPSAKYDRTQRPLQLEFNYNNPISKALQAVTDLTYNIVRNESVNKKQVYITGLSMGGMGTFEMVYRNPKLFAAAAPICGGGDASAYSKKQTKTRYWIFRGDADAVVEVKYSRAMVERLKDLKADVRYTEYKDVNHNSWDNAFAEPNFLEWMFNKDFKLF
ncbi:MAG TPA: dienelactone hydrolase family protein [Cyclobacteriaceae bacterium]|nr:dienelactone hydrolase family protein [Cyclobacteriaceae bacterium]